MEDFIKSIKAFLYDRTSSPLFGALVITWLTSNYKAVLISISGTDIEKKLHLLSAYFNEVYCQWAFNHAYVQFTWDIPNWIARGIGYPVAATIIYIFVYPFFAEHVYKFSQSNQAKLKVIKLDAEKKTPISFEKSQELYTKLHLADAQHAKAANEYRDEIDQLKQTVNLLQAAESKAKKMEAEIMELKEENRKLTFQPTSKPLSEQTEKAIDSLRAMSETQVAELSNEELEVLKYIGRKGEVMLFDTFWLRPPFGELKTKAIIESLRKKDFLFLPGGGYQLTTKAINKLLEFKEFDK